MKNSTQLKRFNNFLNQFKNQHLLLKVFIVFSLLNSNFFYSKEIAANFKERSFGVRESNSFVKSMITNGSLTSTAIGSYAWSGLLGSNGNASKVEGRLNSAPLNLPITVNTFTVGTSCGATITSLATTINTPVVFGATSYTFRVKNKFTNSILIIDRSVNSFAFSNYAGITLGTPYQIEVSTNGGVSYGAPCLLNTPFPFSTIGVHCGATLSSISENIYCTAAPSVTGYRFRVTNTTTNVTQLLNTLVNRFNLNQLASKSFATTYLVEVAVRDTDGITYLPYSKGCEITTPPYPTTRIRPLQCNEIGYQATSNTENIVAVIISGASDYRFYLSNSGLGYSSSIDLPTNKFCLNLFSGLVSEKTYSVQVAVKIGGNWGPYGAICKITTPGFGKTIPSISNEFKPTAYPNPFAEDFMFNLKTASDTTIQIMVYDMLGKQIENRNVEVADIENLQLGANYTSGIYNVIVSQENKTQSLRVIKR